jgi:hypothetical protein
MYSRIICLKIRHIARRDCLNKGSNSIKSIELQVLRELDSTRVTIFFKQLKNYDDMIGRF